MSKSHDDSKDKKDKKDEKSDKKDETKSAKKTTEKTEAVKAKQRRKKKAQAAKRKKLEALHAEDEVEAPTPIGEGPELILNLGNAESSVETKKEISGGSTEVQSGSNIVTNVATTVHSAVISQELLDTIAKNNGTSVLCAAPAIEHNPTDKSTA